MKKIALCLVLGLSSSGLLAEVYNPNATKKMNFSSNPLRLILQQINGEFEVALGPVNTVGVGGLMAPGENLSVNNARAFISLSPMGNYKTGAYARGSFDWFSLDQANVDSATEEACVSEYELMTAGAYLGGQWFSPSGQNSRLSVGYQTSLGEGLTADGGCHDGVTKLLRNDSDELFLYTGWVLEWSVGYMF